MELRQLSYFKAVAEELHFGRAAARVRIAQPALSNHVMALERELGCALFIRSTRRVELTRAGETFYDRCVRILSEVDLTTELTRAAGGSRMRQIKIGTVYPATIGMLPTFLAKIARKFPDVKIHIAAGNTGEIIRNLESGQINLGFIRPVENIGALRFFSIASERYYLAVGHGNPLSERDEITIDDLSDQKLIAFSRQNLSFSERYFQEKFEAYDLVKNIAYSCDDTWSLVSLVSAGLGIGFVPEWTRELPNRAFELKKVRGIDFRIGLGVAWNREDPTASRDDIVDIARSLARPGR
ncbi:DNA-binding transcriptional LysR family regulator [Rhizobium mesoamericanum]|uniref:LysR family transcriptional regulator n=1 Tax=Rhizobium mesoamericanum TaxID=1079800 RepID=UPI00277D6960|nr:LysR family transcriptional regulator [Rhizobium mesoamericanum]MDQ0561931.1 DNA-binding transcriptional LysR family regulator [Rhizobium mesoamericanum]